MTVAAVVQAADEAMEIVVVVEVVEVVEVEKVKEGEMGAILVAESLGDQARAVALEAEEVGREEEMLAEEVVLGELSEDFSEGGPEYSARG